MLQVRRIFIRWRMVRWEVAGTYVVGKKHFLRTARDARPVEAHPVGAAATAVSSLRDLWELRSLAGRPRLSQLR